jgi:hypothetical protein
VIDVGWRVWELTAFGFCEPGRCNVSPALTVCFAEVSAWR